MANNKKMPEKKSKSGHMRQKAGFSRRNLAIFVSSFTVVGVGVLLISSAAPSPPTVYLSPTTQTLPANTAFSVQVRENSGAAAVNAVQANFSYDASLVSFVSVDTSGSAFGTTAQATGGSGSVNIGLGTSCSSTCSTVTGDQLVATVNFKTLTTTGSTAMAFTSGTMLVNNGSDILGGLANTAGATFTVDATAPTVSVTSPASGATVGAPATTTISVSASDNISVSSVDIYIDGTKVKTLTSAPYNYSWNTSGASLGTHTIQAKATDPSGNVGSSSTSTVTLADQTAPTTSVTAPSSGSTIKGTVTFSANASDNTGGTGVAKVEFYVDGVLKSTDTSSPYSYGWDTTTATNAAHSLTIKAYDKASPANVTTGTAVNVTVDNSAPTQPGSFRTTGNSLSSIALAWNASTDNNSVTGYRITRNGTTITTTSGTTLSYTDNGLSSGTSYSYTIVALDTAGNTSAAANLNASTVTPAKVGDINGDNSVSLLDLSLLLSSYGQNRTTCATNTSYTCDLNGDSTVNILDLSILLLHYGS